jgi:WD40 repeat protein
VAITPDGTLLGTANILHAVKIWRVRTRMELGFSQMPGGFISRATTLPGGRLIAAGPHYDAVRIWELPSNQVVGTLTGETGTSEWFSPWFGVDLSPDGQWLVCNGIDGVRLWDVTSGRELRTLYPGGFGGPVVFSQGARRLVAAACGDQLIAWEAHTGKELFHKKRPRKNATVLTFSPDEQTLAVGCRWADHVQLYNCSTGQERFSLGTNIKGLEALAWSPDGKLLATGGQARLYLWDVAAGKVARTFMGFDATVNAAAFHPDGTTLAWGNRDGTVRVWDIRTGTEQRRIQLVPHEAQIFRVAYTPDGRHLLTCNGNGTLYILRLAPPPS